MSTPLASRPSRRFRFRFSLRTLLVLITLLACWLGYQTWRWREHDKAVATLVALGGEVSFAKSAWVHALTGEKPFKHVTAVNLHRVPATDEHLRMLTWFPRVESLVLNRSKVTDVGMQHLAKLPKLRWLELEGVDIGDEGLAELKDLPSLKVLRVTG